MQRHRVRYVVLDMGSACVSTRRIVRVASCDGVATLCSHLSINSRSESNNRDGDVRGRGVFLRGCTEKRRLAGVQRCVSSSRDNEFFSHSTCSHVVSSIRAKGVNIYVVGSLAH